MFLRDGAHRCWPGQDERSAADRAGHACRRTLRMRQRPTVCWPPCARGAGRWRSRSELIRAGLRDLRNGHNRSTQRTTACMEVSRIRALRGPNLWSRHTAIEAIVTLHDERARHRRAARVRGAPARPLPRDRAAAADGPQRAVPLAHVLELAALGLQAQAGCPVTFSRTTATLEPGVYQVVVEYSEEAVGRAGARTGAAAVRGRAGRRARSIWPRARRAARTGRGRAPGPQHRFHRLGRRGARHSLSAPDARQPGAVRLGQQAAPHPGGRNRPYQRHRRDRSRRTRN